VSQAQTSHDGEKQGQKHAAHMLQACGLGSSQRRRRFAESGRYRGTSLVRKRTPLGPYRRSIPRVLGGSYGGGRFLMSEVPL
jgi:hypothetical protein